MSQIQMMPGPMDSLYEGLIVGSKLAANQAAIKTAKIQNALLTKELEHYDQKAQLDQIHTMAKIDHENASTQVELVKGLIQAKMAELDAQYKTAQIATEQQKPGMAQGEFDLKKQTEQRQAEAAHYQNLGTLTEALKRLDTTDFTPEDIMAGAKSVASQLGMDKVQPGDTRMQFLVQQLTAQAQKAKQELQTTQFDTIQKVLPFMVDPGIRKGLMGFEGMPKEVQALGQQLETAGTNVPYKSPNPNPSFDIAVQVRDLQDERGMVMKDINDFEGQISVMDDALASKPSKSGTVTYGDKPIQVTELKAMKERLLKEKKAKEDRLAMIESRKKDLIKMVPGGKGASTSDPEFDSAMEKLNKLIELEQAKKK